jgi:hypothetical protein
VILPFNCFPIGYNSRVPSVAHAWFYARLRSQKSEQCIQRGEVLVLAWTRDVDYHRVPG